jgi:hypothetical protein
MVNPPRDRNAVKVSKLKIRLAATLTLGVVAMFLGLTPVDSAEQVVVVPNGLATVVGNGGFVAPFNCNFLGFATSMRYQQVYLGSEVGSGTITQLAFRTFSVFGGPFGPTTISMWLSHFPPLQTARTIAIIFASNIGADV